MLQKSCRRGAWKARTTRCKKEMGHELGSWCKPRPQTSREEEGSQRRIEKGSLMRLRETRPGRAQLSCIEVRVYLMVMREPEGVAETSPQMWTRDLGSPFWLNLTFPGTNVAPAEQCWDWGKVGAGRVAGDRRGRDRRIRNSHQASLGAEDKVPSRGA